MIRDALVFIDRPPEYPDFDGFEKAQVESWLLNFKLNMKELDLHGCEQNLQSIKDLQAFSGDHEVITAFKEYRDGLENILVSLRTVQVRYFFKMFPVI